MQLQTSEKFQIPAPAGAVQDFLNQLPRQAELTFSVSNGGDQRDPYPASITIIAKWNTNSLANLGVVSR